MTDNHILLSKKNCVWAYEPSRYQVQLREKALPKLKKGEILIENKAIGINPVDWKLIRTNQLNWPDFHIPGVDGLGIVVALSKEVDQSLLGQRVAYHCNLKKDGSFAVFTRVLAKRVMTVPDSMSDVLAASLPCPMLTSWQACEKIPKRKEASILVTGLGAVSKWLVQLLLRKNFYVDVLSKSLTRKKADTLGIRNIYREKSNIPISYFAIYDAISAESAASLVPYLKANGHIIAIQDRIQEPIDPAFTRAISYHETALGALHEYGDSVDWKILMTHGEKLMDEVVAEKIIVEYPVIFSFNTMPEALKHSETTKLKTVITCCN